MIKLAATIQAQKKRRAEYWRYIDSDAAQALREYKYAGEDRSYLYKYVLTPMNAFLIEFVPHWMAPNLITTIGLLFTALGHLLTAYHSPSFDQPLPQWVYFTCAFCIFAYQTIDNLDGRQARRTGSSSPLGLLFDHGIDALNATVATMMVAACFQIGSGVQLLWMWLMVVSVFAVTTWEEYHTGKLVLPEVNGPSDGQMISALCLVVAGCWPGIMGSRIADTALGAYLAGTPMAEWPVSYLPLSVGAIGWFPTVLSCAYSVSKQVPLLRALPSLLPFIMHMIFALMWAYYSPTRVLHNHPRIFLLGFGFLFALLACRLMLAHLCSKNYAPAQSVLAPLAILSTNVLQPVFTQSGAPWLAMKEDTALYIFSGLSFLMWLHFVTQVIWEITTLLDIQCFRIKPAAAAKKEQ